MRLYLASALLFLGIPGQMLCQCMLVESPLSERIENAGIIVEGKVTAQQSAWNTQHTHIITTSTIELYKVLKGSLQTDKIQIECTGGMVDLDREVSSSLLSLNNGETGLFFCNPTNTGNKYEAYASKQGFIGYNLSENLAYDVFKVYPGMEKLYGLIKTQSHQDIKEIRPLPIPHPSNLRTQGIFINTITPDTISAGTGSVLTITGSGFGTYKAGSDSLSFRNADDGGASYGPAAEIISWVDDEIKAKVPHYAGSGKIKIVHSGVSAQGPFLVIPFSNINISDGKHFSPGYHINQNNGGYVWSMNKDFKADAAASAAFYRAFNTWKCTSFLNAQINKNTTNITTYGADGLNLIGFASNLPARVLGECQSFYKGCRDEHDNITWYLTEMDLVFLSEKDLNTQLGLSYEYGPASPVLTTQLDFETIIFHELGHVHQLGHTNDKQDMMYYAQSGGPGGQKRFISDNDKAGASYILARDINMKPCSNYPMVLLNSTSCMDNTPVDVSNEELVVHQNPFHTSTQVVFYTGKNEQVTARLFNFMGKEVNKPLKSDMGSYTYTVNIDDSMGLAEGLYILGVYIGDEFKSVKLLKY